MQTAAASPPNIFDKALARVRLRRAWKTGFADFLLRHAAEDLADRLASVSRSFARVAEIGAPGPHIAEMLQSNDPEREVVRFAPATPARHETPRRTIVGDAEMLPSAEGRFDLAVSILALQGANDLLGALVQIRRSLKPDGLFIGCMVGGGSLFELRNVLAMAEAEIDGGTSPRVAPFARVQDMSGVMQRAGFEMPVVDIDPLVIRYPGFFELLRDLRAMGATNVMRERRRAPLKRTVLLRAADIYAAEHADPDGRLRATCELIWLSGWTQPAAVRCTASDAPSIRSQHRPDVRA